MTMDFLKRVEITPRAVALLIALFYLLDRAFGLYYLLPFFCVEDERFARDAGLRLLTGLALDPGTHKYPGLLPLLTAATYGLSYLAANARAVLHLESWASFVHHLNSFNFDFTSTILLGRIEVIVIGMMALLFFHRLCLKEFGAPRSSAATLLLATSPAFLFSSQMLKTETLLVLCVLIAIAASLRVLKRGRRIDYLAAGAAIGLALAAKYHLASVVPLLFAHRLRHRDLSLLKSFTQWRWLLFAPAALAVFFAFSPYSIIDFGGFVRQGMMELAIQNRLDPLFRRSSELWWHAPVIHLFLAVMPMTLGFPVYALALYGLVRKINLAEPSRLVFWSYPAGFLAFMIAFSELGSPHLYVTVAPFGALLAAAAVEPLLSSETRLKRVFGVALVGGAALYGLILIHSLIRYEDYVIRESVMEMEATHQPGGNDIGLVPYYPNPDRPTPIRFAPQTLLSERTLAQSDADRLLVHHVYYASYGDNPELLAGRVAEMYLAYLYLRKGELGYTEDIRFTGYEDAVPTGKIYAALWPDFKGLWTSIYVREENEK